jgi:Zn-dependent protease with chaperone function
MRAPPSIERHASFDVPSRMEAFIENPMASWVSGLFSAHPSVADRVEALRRYAGALREPPPP